MLDTMKKNFMDEWKGHVKVEENYFVSGMLDIRGSENDTVRYGEEAGSNRLGV